MLKEEFRFHTSFTSKWTFSMYPFLIFGAAFVICANLSMFIYEINLPRVLFLSHVSLAIYGITTGSLGFFGREMTERRFGHVNFLLSTPSLLPISFKKVFVAFYIKDALFYIGYTILPAVLGLGLSIPFSNLPAYIPILLFITTTCAFILGMSFSFCIAAVYMHSRKLFLGISYSLVAIVLFAIAGRYFGFIGEVGSYLDLSLRGIMLYLSLIILLIFAFTTIAYFFIDDKFEPEKSISNANYVLSEKKWSIFGSYATLLAKEFVDIDRSKTFTKLAFSFVFPLVFLAGLSYVLRRTTENAVGFNTIFYAGMIGFFGVLVYSWLNNMDINDYFQYLPIKVSKVIKTKLIAYHLTCTWISSIFVIFMGVLNGDLNLLGCSLFVMFCTSTYISAVTAYLTGLKTNTYLFNIAILLKFNIYSLLPLILITFYSLSLQYDFTTSLVVLLSVSFILLLATAILWKGIDVKWDKASFID